MASAASAGLAGLMLAGYSDGATLRMGDSYLLPSIAAVVVGGSSILGGSGSFAATVGGALLLDDAQHRHRGARHRTGLANGHRGFDHPDRAFASARKHLRASETVVDALNRTHRQDGNALRMRTFPASGGKKGREPMMEEDDKLAPKRACWQGCSSTTLATQADSR